jgi:hypothetical protein
MQGLASADLLIPKIDSAFLEYQNTGEFIEFLFCCISVRRIWAALPDIRSGVAEFVMTHWEDGQIHGVRSAKIEFIAREFNEFLLGDFGA